MIGKTLLSSLFLQAVILAACAVTQAPNYYLLSPIPGSGPPERDRVPCITIGMQPVEVPRYLERPQIVVRENVNELEISEFDLWAEPLKNTITRVIVENLETLTCADIRGIRPGLIRQNADYRLNVEITRLDGSLGDKAVLEAVWSVAGGADSRELFVRKSRLTKKIGWGYESLVSAQSELLAELSREMADVFALLSPEIARDRQRIGIGDVR